MSEEQRRAWKDAIAANAKANRRRQVAPRRTGLDAVGVGCIRIMPAADDNGNIMENADQDDQDDGLT